MEIAKIFRMPEWAAFTETGHFAGSADDLGDGFIHLSTGAQLEETLRRHFAGAGRVMVAWLNLAADPALRFEPARSGALFPHLYRPLHWDDVLQSEERTCED